MINNIAIVNIGHNMSNMLGLVNKWEWSYQYLEKKLICNVKIILNFRTIK